MVTASNLFCPDLVSPSLGLDEFIITNLFFLYVCYYSNC